mgnify:CR=1 FL=1
MQEALSPEQLAVPQSSVAPLAMHDRFADAQSKRRVPRVPGAARLSSHSTSTVPSHERPPEQVAGAAPLLRHLRAASQAEPAAARQVTCSGSILKTFDQ